MATNTKIKVQIATQIGDLTGTQANKCGNKIQMKIHKVYLRVRFGKVVHTKRVKTLHGMAYNNIDQTFPPFNFEPFSFKAG